MLNVINNSFETHKHLQNYTIYKIGQDRK